MLMIWSQAHRKRRSIRILENMYDMCIKQGDQAIREEIPCTFARFCLNKLKRNELFKQKKSNAKTNAIPFLTKKKATSPI